MAGEGLRMLQRGLTGAMAINKDKISGFRVVLPCQIWRPQIILGVVGSPKAKLDLQGWVCRSQLSLPWSWQSLAAAILTKMIWI